VYYVLRKMHKGLGRSGDKSNPNTLEPNGLLGIHGDLGLDWDNPYQTRPKGSFPTPKSIEILAVSVEKKSCAILLCNQITVSNSCGMS
jgi:hypothetical protein